MGVAVESNVESAVRLPGILEDKTVETMHVEDKRLEEPQRKQGYMQDMQVCSRGTVNVFEGDCVYAVQRGWVKRGSVNLIVTSPPYADQRSANYGGVHPDEYVDWFLPRALTLRDCLAQDGSFVLNIKEKAVAGEKHTYVYDLVLALRRQQGWRLVDEYCWHKKNCYPGKWPNRFRDSWERLFHFTVSPGFKMRQESVMVLMGDWKQARLRNLSDTDRMRDESKHRNGFAKRVENWVGRDLAYPTNVLHMATECGSKGHPAAFPKELPDWFIRLFTDEGDTVLDPFAGSGTTLLAALNLRRNAIGIDTSHEYCTKMRQSVTRHETSGNTICNALTHKI